MDDEQKKKVKVIVAVSCIVLAGLVTVISSMGSGIDETRFKTVWVICTSEECDSVYEVDRKKLNDQVVKEGNPMGLGRWAFKCSQCNEKTAFLAVVCSQCEEIFMPDYTPGDRYDRCPECGYSEIENRLEK